MTARPMTPSRLGNLGANAIARGFERLRSRFLAVTHRARSRFEQRDIHGMQKDAVERLDLYREVVDHVVDEIQSLLGGSLHDEFIWVSLKAVYSGLISDRDDWELAETFFNSITRRIFTTVGVDPRIEFVDTDFDRPPTRSPASLFHTYEDARSSAALIESVLTDFRFGVLYQDLRRDARLAAERLDAHLAEIGHPHAYRHAEILQPVFFRGRAAYLVGRLTSGSTVVPLVLALRNREGVVVDAIFTSEDDVSILFGFAHSYFHVAAERPYDLVQFLKSLMPRKRIAELYTSIGHHKHGKTELYRDLLDHLASTDARFEAAPGEAGLVMMVFTMPDYDMVFKIVRDSFGVPKQTTREAVMDKYRVVFRHDRVGRLIDAQEFEHLAFDRRRFDEGLLATLLTACNRTVGVAGDRVTISHCYVERRVDPLNLFIRTAGEEAARQAVVDYGRAVKDLAAANIFPGDLLIKNFGVTRHGRVVFYDYDELADITSCVFRELPEPVGWEDELGDFPTYGVGPDDVFPAEFRSFLGMPRALREVFERHHGDLYTVEFWQAMKARHEAGEIVEFFPYDQSDRLSNT